MANSIYRMPPEIWASICDCLILPDIASFRLVCRVFGRIGAPYLVRKIIIRMETDDFDRFRALANDPTLSGHVRSLLYTPNVYRMAGPDAPPPNSRGSHPGIRRSQLVEAEYKEVCKDQIRIQDSGLEPALFTETLPKLANLRRIVIHCDGWPQHSLCTKPRRLIKGDWHNPGKPIHNNGGIPGRRALASVLGALKVCDTKLLELEVGRAHWRAIGDLCRTCPQLDLFSSLVSLTLQLCICHIADPCNNRQRHPDHDEYCRLREDGVLSGFLASLYGLETLVIGFCAIFTEFGHAVSSPFVPWLKDVVPPGHRWPRLASFALFGLNLRKAELLDVLERHSETLRRLELRRTALDTNWAAALLEIRTILPLRDALVWCWLHHPVPIVHRDWVDSDDERACYAGKYLTLGGVCPVTDVRSVAGCCFSEIPASAKISWK
jgi:hypothetical protein